VCVCVFACIWLGVCLLNFKIVCIVKLFRFGRVGFGQSIRCFVCNGLHFKTVFILKLLCFGRVVFGQSIRCLVRSGLRIKILFI